MKLKIFTIYDSKAEYYSQPYFASSLGEMLRSFTAQTLDPKSKLGLYPEDYTLFEIGHYDDHTAIVTMHDAKVSHGLALEAQIAEKNRLARLKNTEPHNG